MLFTNHTNGSCRQRSRVFLTVFLWLVLVSPTLFAATYYVDVDRGADNQSGSKQAPFKSIARAISLTHAGDTVIIVKIIHPIHQTITIRSKSGEPGHPIVIDGQGNLFTGADTINTAEWALVGPGIYRNSRLLPELHPGEPASTSTIRRFFMIFNGVQNRMGRSSKGTVRPLVAPDKLQPGEWTYEDSQTAFYIAIDPNKKLADYHIEAPVRQDGVDVRGTCKHWVIRNINVRHVINDGFNIHGHTEDVLFEHITATECGDDGISAHEDCELTIKDFKATRNSTGMCHGDPYVTCRAEHILLEDNYAYNLLLRDGVDTIIDSRISAIIPQSGLGGIALTNELAPETPKPLSVTFINCTIPFTDPRQLKASFKVNKGVILHISNDTRLDGDIEWLPERKRP